MSREAVRERRPGRADEAVVAKTEGWRDEREGQVSDSKKRQNNTISDGQSIQSFTHESMGHFMWKLLTKLLIFH